MTAYLLALDCEVPIAGKGTTRVRQYWTGHRGPNGGPQRTLWKAQAMHFRTSEIALAVANTHSGLKNSEEWKVVRRA